MNLWSLLGFVLGLHTFAPAQGATAVIQEEASKPRIHMVPGPESPDVFEGLSGRLIIEWPVGGILGVAIPSGDQTTVRRRGRTSEDKAFDPAYSLSGPDADGRIAVIERDIVNGIYRLKTVGWDGKDERLLEEREAHPRAPYGAHIALSPDGKRIAFLHKISGIQLRDPDAWLTAGDLQIFDVETKKATSYAVSVREDVLTWTADSKQLAYTCLIESADAQKLLAENVGAEAGFGAKYRKWAKVPAAAILDIASGSSRIVHVGDRAVIAPDGSKLLVRDFELQWRIVDLPNGTSTPTEAKGAIYPGAISFLDPHRILYWAWPTEGAESSLTTSNSPMVGPKQMRTLKVVDLRDGRFATLVPAIDPRNAVGVGR